MDRNVNAIATSILAAAAEQLRAHGLHCVIGPITMPQGLSLNLHVADTKPAVAAAYVALGHGGQLAHASDTSGPFAEEVAEVLATDAIEKAARG
jgi:hypothetical protein